MSAFCQYNVGFANYGVEHVNGNGLPHLFHIVSEVFEAVRLVQTVHQGES
jgi:hypothetical protein